MGKLSEQGNESDLQATTPEWQLEMMWQLARDAWPFTDESAAKSRLPRHVVRAVR